MAGIYAYWEGTRHWYYDLCWQTVLRHNPGARLLGRSDVEEVLGPLPPEVEGVYVVHRVDWLRKAWIGAAGGLWLDMDFICLRSLASLEGLSGDFDFVGWREWPGNWMDNLFAGRRGSPFLHTAADYALDRAREPGRSWLSTNADAIAHAMHEHPWCNWMQIPTHLVSPVSVMEPQWFRDRGRGDAGLRTFKSFGFMTSFHGLGDWLKASYASGAEFLGGGSRVAELIKIALE